MPCASGSRAFANPTRPGPRTPAERPTAPSPARPTAGLGKQVGELEHVGDLLPDSRPVAIKRDRQRQLVEPRRSPPPERADAQERKHRQKTKSRQEQTNRQTESKQPIEEDEHCGRHRQDDHRVGRELEDKLEVQSPAQASKLARSERCSSTEGIET